MFLSVKRNKNNMILLVDGGNMDGVLETTQLDGLSHIDFYFYVSLFTSLLLVSRTIPSFADVIIFFDKYSQVLPLDCSLQGC